MNADSTAARPHVVMAGPQAVVRVALLNDYPLVVAGLFQVLSRYPERVRVVQATVGKPDLAGLVDVLLYDVFAQKVDLETVLEQVDTKVVVFTEILDPAAVVGALRAGVAGYVFKGVSEEQLVDSIVSAAASPTPVVALRPAPGLPATMSHWPGMGHDLTSREAEVIALACRGLTNVEIANQMFLSVNSVKTYIRFAYRKMGVDSRAKAVLWGAEHGFVSLGNGQS